MIFFCSKNAFCVVKNQNMCGKMMFCEVKMLFFCEIKGEFLWQNMKFSTVKINLCIKNKFWGQSSHFLGG